MKFNRIAYIALFILLLFTIIFRSSTNIWGFRENSIISFLLAISFLMVSLKIKKVESLDFKPHWYHWTAIFALGFIASYQFLKKIIVPWPMDKTQSDVIPQMQTLVQRFLNGETVYQTIHFVGYDLFPTYLPLQWAAFIIPEKLHLDYRLFALTILSAVFIFFIKGIKNEKIFAFLAILPFLITIIWFGKDENSYYNCVENMMAAYYMAFALSLCNSKRIWLQVLLFSCCLFSRYSIILWSPVFFLYLYIHNGYRIVLKAGLGVIFVFLVVYFIPFLSHDFSIFSKGYAYHSQAALGEWQVPQWNQNGIPVHLSNGLGFAIFFYEKVSGQLADKLAALQKVHIILSLLSVLISIGIGWYQWKVQQKKPNYFFLLWTLAFYLTIFYYFIQIPYAYLFVVPVYVYLVLFRESLLKA